MREASDDLCREYGLSVIENPQCGKSQHYGEWRAEKEGRPTWKSSIKDDIDEAIRQSMTERQFWAYLQSHGYQVKIGKDISVRPPGKERFVRLARNLGEDYTLARIRERIISHSRGGVLPEYERIAQRTEYRHDLAKVKKATGFRALYYHYCYLLGIFPQKKPSYPHTRVHHLLREDLMKMDAISEEARLLRRHNEMAYQIYNIHLCNGEVIRIMEDYDLPVEEGLIGEFEKAPDDKLMVFGDMAGEIHYVPKKNIVSISTSDVKVVD